jgi:hypothetical protein
MLGDSKIDAESAENLLLVLAKISHKGGDDTMKDERMKILQMLEDGKISAENAEDLLIALAKTEQPHKYWHTPHIDLDKEKFGEKFGQFAESVDAFAKECSCKAQEVYKDVEPKIRSAAKAVIEKTAALADEISKNLNDSIRKMEEEVSAKKQEASSDVVYNKPDENK